MDEAKFEKLPKWAQQEIQRLTRDVEHAERRLAASLTPPAKNHPAYGDYDDCRGMGLQCRKVWFRDHGISVSADDDGVQIHGDGALTIHPHVTNVIAIRSDRVDRE